MTFMTKINITIKKIIKTILLYISITILFSLLFAFFNQTYREPEYIEKMYNEAQKIVALDGFHYGRVFVNQKKYITVITKACELLFGWKGKSFLEENKVIPMILSSFFLIPTKVYNLLPLTSAVLVTNQESDLEMRYNIFPIIDIFRKYEDRIICKSYFKFKSIKFFWCYFELSKTPFVN